MSEEPNYEFVLSPVRRTSNHADELESVVFCVHLYLRMEDNGTCCFTANYHQGAIIMILWHHCHAKTLPKKQPLTIRASFQFQDGNGD